VKTNLAILLITSAGLLAIVVADYQQQMTERACIAAGRVMLDGHCAAMKGGK
jgi:hypothetical protein